MSKTKGFIYGSVSAATFGLIPLFSLPIMAKGIHFDSILCYRFLIAAIAIGGLMWGRGESFRVTSKELLTLIGLGTFYSASAMFLFWSYRLMAAGIAATILFLYPVFVAVLMRTLFREKISWITNLAIGVAIIGVALLYMGDGDGSLSIAGIIVVLLSALSYALYIVGVNKSGVQHMNGTKITFYSLLVGMVLFFTKAQSAEGMQILPDWESWLNVVLLAVIPTMVSCITMVWSVQYIGSTYTSVLGAMEPLTAVCVGVFVFGEPFTPNLAAGILLIILSVTLIILSKVIQRSMEGIRHMLHVLLLRR